MNVKNYIYNYKRYRQADKKGWQLFGQLLTADQDDQKKVDWIVRNANRLYRLTRDRKNKVKLLGA